MQPSDQMLYEMELENKKLEAERDAARAEAAALRAALADIVSECGYTGKPGVILSLRCFSLREETLQTMDTTLCTPPGAGKE